MSARCLQCGTTLSHEGVGHSDLYRKAVRGGDTRILAGIGGLAGAAIGALATSMINDVSMDELWHYPWLRAIVGLCAAAGGLAGRAIAWHKNRFL